MCKVSLFNMMRAAVIRWVAISLAFFAFPIVLSSQTTTRPISEFVAAQGTFCWPDGSGGCLLFVPPIPNFIGWTQGFPQPTPHPPEPERSASIDYAGLANAWLISQGRPSLGTAFRGTVTDRPLPDGRAEVTVILHTTKALSWVVDGFDFAGGDLLFGRRAPDVSAGGPASLGDSFLQVVFVNTTPGAPLPDLLQLINFPIEGQELRFLSFRAQAEGQLRTAFGVPDGTPGRLTVVQTGLFMTPFKGAVGDGFPAEKVELKIVGK